MPVIVEMRLRADRDSAPTTRQLHGLACSLYEGMRSGNHEGQDKPFSVWPLTPVPDGWILRSAWLAAGVPQTLLAGCGQLQLGPVACQVTELAYEAATHAELTGALPGLVADLRFCSPTYFAHNGTTIVLPAPSLIISSWAKRWDTSAPSSLRLGHLLTSEVEAAARITDFDLHTEARDRGYGSRTGFTGTARLRLARGTAGQVQSAFSTLARFARYCGTGAQTTHGFGATTVTLDADRPIRGPDDREAASRR